MITRREYMGALPADPDASMAAHRSYYAQFVTSSVFEAVRAHIRMDKILASKDPFFADIPIEKWNLIWPHPGGRECILAPMDVQALLREAGEGNSIATGSAVLKEAARQMREAALSTPGGITGVPGYTLQWHWGRGTGEGKSLNVSHVTVSPIVITPGCYILTDALGHRTFVQPDGQSEECYSTEAEAWLAVRAEIKGSISRLQRDIASRQETINALTAVDLLAARHVKEEPEHAG